MRTTTSAALLVLLATPLLGASSRSVEATFVATLHQIPAGAKQIEVWVPLPRDTERQTIRDLVIESRHQWQRRTERDYGNSYLYTTINRPREGMELLRLRFRATRQEITLSEMKPATVPQEELQRDLRADRLLTLSPRVRRLAEDVTRGRTDRLSEAKAIYEYVVSTMKYDKTIPGWGRGDTERACDVRTGNCTDFHSLFISLARAKGIPARFVIGYPMNGTQGEATGYHCWAEFYLPEKGWVPVDPSEASKSSDPARRMYLFTNLDPDRIEFTRGRDLRLTPPTAEPVNFFIYPRAETNGEEVGRAQVSLRFRDIDAPPIHAVGSR